MQLPAFAERALYRDLARMFMAMRTAPYAEVETAIETRLRQFMQTRAGRTSRGLEITLTVIMPDGPDSLPVQTTRYRTLSAAEVRSLHPGLGETALPDRRTASR